MTNGPLVIDQELVDWMQSKILERTSIAGRTEPIDEIKLISAIKQLYGLRELTAPKVVVCKSPLQMRLMPMLFLCPKLDQMFTQPNKTIGEQVRTNLTNLIGTDVTTSLYAIFEKNFKSGDEPGEFLMLKNGSILRTHLDKEFTEAMSDVLDSSNRMQFTERYFEIRQMLGRNWSLFDHVQAYLSQLPKNVVVPMDETLQEKVLLQISMNLKTTLAELNRHLTLARVQAVGSWINMEVDDLVYDIATERMNRQIAYPLSRKIIWDALVQAHLIYPFKNICFVCEFPTKIMQRDGILHCEDQAALEYGDGLKLHFWNGVRVPAQFIEQPSSITASQITAERNTELRRLMIEIMGAENYIKQSGAVPIQQDEFGTLYQFGSNRFGDNVTMVRLVNSTAESDGSRRVYWLSVPPTVRTAKEAVAWSFSMPESEYGPIVES